MSCQGLDEQSEGNNDEQKRWWGVISSRYRGMWKSRESQPGGALILPDMDGQEGTKPINSDAVKRYYAWKML